MDGDPCVGAVLWNTSAHGPTGADERGGLLVDDVTVLAQDVPGADDAQIRKLLRRAGHGG